MLWVKLLGEAVSREKCFIEGLSVKRVVKILELTHILPYLRDPQSKHILVQSCMGITKIFLA